MIYSNDALFFFQNFRKVTVGHIEISSMEGFTHFYALNECINWLFTPLQLNINS